MLRLRYLALFLLFSTLATAQAANEPVLKSYEALAYPPIARAARVSGRVTVEFSINGKGETADVASTDGPRMLRGSAETFIKSWKFDVGNAAIGPGTKYRSTVDFKAVLRVVDPRDDPKPRVSSDSFHHFEITVLISDIELSNCPTGVDEDVPSTTAQGDFVEISRSACMGSCPDYSVRVQADGVVAWNGRWHVAIRGKHESSIDPSLAHELLEGFRTKEFWSYCGSYWRNITDSSGTEITVRLGGRTRKISDYAESGPEELQDLLMAVDRTADSHRWRHGDPAKEPITRIDSDVYLPKPGVTPLMVAAGSGEMEKLKALIAAGADVKAVDSSGWSALMYAARAMSGFTVQELLKAGADPNQSSPHGDTPLMVSALSGNWNEVLVKAGADVNAQNKDGQTALMFLAARDEVDEIRNALRAGADAALRDKKGRTALDYLKLASCGKSPFYDPVTDGSYGYLKCTAFQADDLHKAEALLNDALQGKK